MPKNIEPQLKSIREYLSLKKSNHFVIPEYQRAYSWDIPQCDKLWQDIEAFIASKGSDPYFFGTIIVDCSSSDQLSLIDGQQRTTTFLLLLKALLINLNKAIANIPDNDEDTEALKSGLKARRNDIISILYKAEPEDIPALLKDPQKLQNILILKNKSINELYPDEVSLIVEAVDFDLAEQRVTRISKKQKDNKYTRHFRNFKYFFEKLSEKKETSLNEFAKILLGECQVIEIRSWDTEQAIMMFNSLNSTGLPLSDADIISAQMYANAGEQKEKFNQQWQEINRLTSKLSNSKIVDINSILQQFMYINRAIKKIYINNKENGQESVDVTTPGLRRYYIDFEKELLKDPWELCQNLTKIVKIWEKIETYPIVKLLLKFNENVKLFLSSYLYRYNEDEITKEVVVEIGECLLRLFTILELVESGYSSAKFKTFLFAQNIKLVDKAVPIDIIFKDFDNHIQKSWNAEEIREAIIDYRKNALVFLNEYIFARDKGMSFNFLDKINIEHIMPSSGRNNAIIQRDANITDKDDFNSLVNQLGNKILLEEDINKSLANDWFKTKKQTTIKERFSYKDSLYPIASTLATYPSDLWTKEDIEKATEKAANRIVNFLFYGTSKEASSKSS
ncbi:DUF262 domain-containing protein [Pelistega suis]|uniref:DUF262 domain-containing protein n=1 Tax=Pelistega suis TaxID=1631957 RepID=UPI00211C5B5C|nr:DUF262 domain-containing HNH endonuclease family protein [Pelistega suis]MCQ9328901.1 DUF262 domain-containing HNH endonuclease family protein [Pelistega suis]